MSHDWESYYRNTQELPAASKTAGFLHHVPHGGRVLDFGAGSGRWAAAFLRDRPDLTIDLLDMNDDYSVLPAHWRGEKIMADFSEFMPTRIYDGIWAYAALFFLKGIALETCFRRLTSSLAPGGVLQFTMVEKCVAAEKAEFYGLTENKLCRVLAAEKLTDLPMFERHNVPYGKEKNLLPTWFVRAVKPSGY